MTQAGGHPPVPTRQMAPSAKPASAQSLRTERALESDLPSYTEEGSLQVKAGASGQNVDVAPKYVHKYS